MKVEVEEDCILLHVMRALIQESLSDLRGGGGGGGEDLPLRQVTSQRQTSPTSEDTFRLTRTDKLFE